MNDPQPTLQPTVRVKKAQSSAGPFEHTEITVTWADHTGTETVVDFLPFYEWRLRRAIDRVLNRLHDIVLRERSWIVSQQTTPTTPPWSWKGSFADRTRP